MASGSATAADSRTLASSVASSKSVSGRASPIATDVFARTSGCWPATTAVSGRSATRRNSGGGLGWRKRNVRSPSKTASGTFAGSNPGHSGREASLRTSSSIRNAPDPGGGAGAGDWARGRQRIRGVIDFSFPGDARAGSRSRRPGEEQAEERRAVDDRGDGRPGCPQVEDAEGRHEDHDLRKGLDPGA